MFGGAPSGARLERLHCNNLLLAYNVKKSIAIEDGGS